MGFGTILRAANMFSALLYAKIFKKRVPIRVALQITKYCNMNCSYCYANFETYKNVGEKTTHELFEVIDKLYSHGTRALWFLGGEPMMRKDFGEIIDYAKNKGIFCDMNSNGTFINEGNINIVKKLDAVCISLDGDEESNDFYRGKGSYQKAIKTIKLLREHKVKVRLHCMLTKRTWKTLDHMAKLSRELGITFNYTEAMLNKSDMEDYLLNEEEEKEFYKKYLDYKKKGYPIMNSLLAIEYIMNWPKKEGTLIYKDEASKYPKNSYVRCLTGDLECFYDIDDRLYACPGTWDDGLNCNEVGFEKAWNHLATRKCISCKCLGATQLNLLLGLRLKSIIHGLKNVIALK